MSKSQLSFQYPEQDNSENDNLPTYDDLATEAGPNSRFGRWKGWVEKRAAERYADMTPQEAARRKARGWDRETSSEHEHGLRLQTSMDVPPPDYPITPPPSSPPPFTGEILSPTHLQINQFGSRFLPHTTSPIHCILPVLADCLVLIGHDDGLSVLNMFPNEWTESGLSNNGPCDATTRVIWQGEAVFQLSLLEVDDTRSGTPTGIVLALVGLPEDSPKDSEPTRSLRMYHLSSLVSLAKWSTSYQYTGPLDLRSSSLGNSRLGSWKKNTKSHGNITKGLKSLGIDSPSSPQIDPFDVLNANRNGASTSTVNSPASTLVTDKSFLQSTPLRSNSVSSTISSWDIVEDLPLRWATDYVSLANAGSRLANSNVSFFEIWSDDFIRGRRGALLAVATKSSILLYETPRSERVFRFVKEFYTPLTPRAMSFVHQAVDDQISRSPSDVGPVRVKQASAPRIASHTAHQRSISTVVPTIRYSNQLSLFVVFEKKAGLIRITDSAVGEVELLDEGQPSSGLHPQSSTRDNLLSPTVHSRRNNRASWDGLGFMKEKATWILPTQVDLTSSITHSSVYLLTRARRTHIVPYPLPANLHGTPSFRVLTWSSTPKHVRARVCHTPRNNETPPSFLQIIAFGEDGLEVQEVPLHSLSEKKGKSPAKPPVQVMADFLGGETRPLCAGGHWHRSRYPDSARYSTVANCASSDSINSLDTDELAARLISEQGIYGWAQKDLSDWRVFWVGGTAATGSQEQT